MLKKIVKNLTWKTAAKFYIWTVGIVATFVTAESNLPEWVPAALSIATLIAGWAKSQYPEPTA